ncbi:MAG: NAD(P)/FAD-dependent oxidoreductase [Candidatus Aenigmarchaeota archaeon]|nr:NAD(P)/FAD-dependent oxidoreductase [Candidatus Aenigmarchaeota archaeon]
MKYDVVVVGAGPAGSSVAKRCAQHSLSVLVAEKRQEVGVYKRCGEGLSNNAVKRLGLKIPKNCIRQKIRGAHIYAPNGKCVEIEYKGSEGYVLERKMFDKWLAEEAVRAGATIRAKTNAVELLKDGRKISGILASTMEGMESIEANVVVAADGVESEMARKAGLYKAKNPMLVDSGFQYEMCGIDIEPNVIELFVGNEIASRGYCWIFPKGKDVANVGVGILGNSTQTAKHYLDRFIESKENLRKGSVLEVNAGCVPVGGFLKNMVSNGLVAVGDAANQVNPLHGGGIAESITAGIIAGNVIKKAHDKRDFTARILSEYNNIWWKERGNSLKKVEKVREMFEKMSDEKMNRLADVLQGEDLYDLAHGKNIIKLAKILVKYKAKAFF